jgi:hypothetical protein
MMTCLFFQGAISQDTGSGESRPGQENQISAEKNLQAALSIPAAKSYYLYAFNTDSSDTTRSGFPIWQRKIVDKKSFSPKHKKNAGLKKYVKPGLIVSAIVLNWTSFYLKRQADNFYSDYKRTSSIKLMNHYYKKAALYDDLSNAALGAAAASLSVFFYYIFTE